MSDDRDHSRPSRAQQMIELGTLTMSSERNGPVHTLRLAGDLDLATTNRVEAELERVEAGDARTIVIDLSDVTFINSTGVHLLVEASLRSRADANSLSLFRGSPTCNGSYRSVASKQHFLLPINRRAPPDR